MTLKPLPLHRKQGIRAFEASSMEALPESISAKRKSQRIMWCIVLIVANVACIIHLCFLLSAFVVQPNSFSITFERQDELTMPRVIICQPTTRFLNVDTLENVTKEYFYALELGLGLIRHDEFQQYVYDMNLTLLKLNYDQIMKEYANISLGMLDFYARHGKKCNDIFKDCYMMQQQMLDCCDIFESTFTMNGFCWVSKKDVLRVRGLSSMAYFRFKLQFQNAIRPRFLPKNEEYTGPLSAEEFAVEPYFFGLMEKLDQSVALAEKWVVNQHEKIDIHLIQNHRKMMFYRDVCIDSDIELKYFREYYEPNCGWERVFFNNLHILLNESTCELPMVELLKPGYSVQNPCTLEQILNLYNYSADVSQPIGIDILEALSIVSNTSLQGILKGKCSLDKSTDNSTLPQCTVDHLKQIDLPPKAKTQVDSLNVPNSMPLSLFDMFGALQLKHNFTDEQTCLPYCETYSHIYRKESVINSDIVKFSDATILMKYTTKEVEFVEESPKSTIAEYIALIGGNFGIWNGASIITLAHSGALFLRCLGFDPFR
jgi:hypothetical protein